MKMKKIALVVSTALLLVAVSGCGPIGSKPNPAPDHKAAVPANGIIEHPERPQGMPADFLNVNWHVKIFISDTGERILARANVKITATSPNAQVQGNVHGGYPFSIYTHTSYTHTIWYQPGIVINTEITATIDPLLGPDFEIECTATANGHDVAVREIMAGGETCISSLSTNHL